MKKILFVVTQSEFGGAQRYIFEVATHLDPQKYEISVAANEKPGELFEKFRIQNVKCKIFPLKHLKRVPWFWQIILSIKEIFDLLKEEQPDILFLCSTTAGLLGSIAASIYKRFIIHNSKFIILYRIGGWAFRDPRPFWQNKILFWAEKLTAPLKDKIIVNSEIDRQEAIKYKICPAEKIVKIYNGIDPEKLEFLSREDAREKLLKNYKLKTINYKLVGTVANFYKTKGLPHLIEATNILTKTYNLKPITYLIIGEGKERKKLESLIKKYNLENTIFLLGKIPDAYKYLKAFDIFVSSSLKEGFPWIILEAMAAEIPIIATNVGAIPEIIEDGKEGILVEPKNSQMLAEKIFWLLNNEEKAQEMVLKAKEKLKNFSLQKMLSETESFFIDLRNQ